MADSTWHEKVNPAASKANRVLGLMENKFSSWSNEIARIIYSNIYHKLAFLSLQHASDNLVIDLQSLILACESL